ncbi:MAG: hypothetical protein R2729_29120 [Bryobacteraceae bacterium]
MNPDLDAHARECGACAALAERERAVEAGLAALRSSLRESTPPASLERKLLAEFEQTRRGRRRFVVWAVWAAAACVVLVMVFAGVGRRRDEPVARNSDGHAVYYALPGMPPADGNAQVMRVRLPSRELQRFGFRVAGPGEVVEADVIVGRDGLPRAIRVAGPLEQLMEQ